MRRKIMRFLNIFILILGGMSIYLYIDDSDIVDVILEYYKKEHTIIISNNYGYKIDNQFVQITDNFTPRNRQDILNIYYTVLASGVKEFTFYCDRKYHKCIDDMQSITSDSSLLARINDFVSPFNSYKKIRLNYTTAGKVKVEIIKAYDEDEIKQINDKIDELYPILVSNTKTTKENIKSVHDYIINNTRYDKNYVAGSDNNKYESNNAYGPLFQGYGICIGYTDLMSIFLDRMGVTNHKISNDKHIWNFVYIDGEWLHLDLTWDDPVLDSGKDHLSYDYFLISTEKLKEHDGQRNITEHAYNEAIYMK